MCVSASALLRYSSHTTRLQLYSVQFHSSGCHHRVVEPRSQLTLERSITLRGSPILISSYSPLLSSLSPPALANCHSALGLWGFAYGERFIEVESYNALVFGTGDFHSGMFPRFSRVSVLHFLLLPADTSLYGYVTFYSPIG